MTYHIIRTLWKLMSLLPMGVLHFISDLIYFPLYYLARYRRKVVRKNLTNAFREKSEKEIIQIEKKFYSAFCDYIVENLKLMGMSPEKVKKHLRFEGTEEVERIMNEKGKSCVLYIGHNFNWEFITSIGLWFKNPDILFGLIYHPLANKAMNRLFIELREQYGAESISMAATLRRVMQLQKEKRLNLIGFLADQVPTWEAINHWLPFFHQDTPVFTGTEKIAQRTSSCVFYLSMHREKRGQYVATFTKIAEDASTTEEHELTNKYYQLLEENIKAQPELWLWTHKRWKRTREGYAKREAKRAKDLQKLKEKNQQKKD